jgi:hypothetical protein
MLLGALASPAFAAARALDPSAPLSLSETVRLGGEKNWLLLSEKTALRREESREPFRCRGENLGPPLTANPVRRCLEPSPRTPVHLHLRSYKPMLTLALHALPIFNGVAPDCVGLCGRCSESP